MEIKLVKEKAFVNGSWIEAKSARCIPVIDPATAQVLGSVPELGAKEVETAIGAAAGALPAWRALSAWDRSSYLRRVYELIVANQEELAKLLTLEQGKPLTEARIEVAYGANYFLWYSEEAKRVYGEILPSSSAQKRIFIRKEPVGVCAAITPWNFPHAMLARKIAPALAAGCTFICKPDDRTPFSALALAAICEEAELPAGVLNVVTGPAALIATTLMNSDTVRKVSFTGSTRVGKLLMAQAADTVKKLTLELGGNAPCIIFADADIERAVKLAISGKFRNGGQSCVAINRFLVEATIFDRVSELLTNEIRKLKVGNGLEPGTQIGPLIGKAAIEKVKSLIDDSIRSGATMLCGEAPNGSSNFVTPTLLKAPTTKLRIFQEEIFGPVAVLYPFSTEQEAIQLANSTEYGLAAYLFTQDLARSTRVQESLEFGMIGINEVAISAAEVPFGGIKHSGFGREGGRAGIEEYLNTKYICVGL